MSDKLCEVCELPEEVHLRRNLGFWGRVSLMLQGSKFFGDGEIVVDGVGYGPRHRLRAAHFGGFRPRTDPPLEELLKEARRRVADCYAIEAPVQAAIKSARATVDAANVAARAYADAVAERWTKKWVEAYEEAWGDD